MKLLKGIQREQRKLARRRAHAARSSMMKRSARYSLFLTNMHGRVGIISSTGKRNLLSHYNAKKRVFARRKISRQLARKLNGNGNFMERWKSKYALGEKNGWGWMMSGSKVVAGRSNTDNSNDNGSTTWKGITLTEPAQQSWFDEEGYPLTSRDPETGRFVNPWSSESSNGENGLKEVLKWKLGGPWCRLLDTFGLSNSGMCGETKDKPEGKTSNIDASPRGDTIKTTGHANSSETSIQESTRTSPCSTVNGLAMGEKFYHTSTADSQTAEESINLTWIGHSSTVVTFPGNFTILTDPHFSNFAGPVKRNAPPAFNVADLPDVVDCVLISHDHMDHLDYWSILDLIESKKARFWIVPLGIKSWLMDKAGVSPEDIIELEWWEGVRISKESKCNRDEMVFPEVECLVHAFDKVTGHNNEGLEKANGSPDKSELVVTCAPAQHWCSRTPFDRNRRLWCSFALHATPALSNSTSQTHSFYFAGDTGLPPEFPLHHQIGDRLGPFDLSAIPIGAYAPEWFMRESHCTPAEAVRIHQAVRSRRSVAIHFDTFDLADEPREEPPKLLLDEVERVNREILTVAAEVVAVADEVGITTGLEQVEGQLGDDVMASSLFVDDLAEPETRVNLMEMLPSLVDFQVIKQGQVIESHQKTRSTAN